MADIGFTNLGRFARVYTGPIRRNPVDDPPPARAVALAGAAADQFARGLANARRVTAKVLCPGAAQATVTRPCPLALVAGVLGYLNSLLMRKLRSIQVTHADVQ